MGRMWALAAPTSITVNRRQVLLNLEEGIARRAEPAIPTMTAVGSKHGARTMPRMKAIKGRATVVLSSVAKGGLYLIVNNATVSM